MGTAEKEQPPTKSRQHGADRVGRGDQYRGEGRGVIEVTSNVFENCYLYYLICARLKSELKIAAVHSLSVAAQARIDTHFLLRRHKRRRRQPRVIQDLS